MPELPEVEHLRRTLVPLLVGRSVTQATLHRRDVAVGPDDPPGGFARQRSQVRPSRLSTAQMLADARIQGIYRRGKLLAVVSRDGRALGIHLGMSGQVLWSPRRGALPRDHVHATWRLDDGSRFVFRDPRRFGGLWMAASYETLPLWTRLGPDALMISPKDFAARLTPAKRPIKAALLDQGLVAGIGNIYADEALHRAGLHPCRLASTLALDQLELLGSCVTALLEAAVEAGGSTLRDYRAAQGQAGGYQRLHRVYGRSGEDCLSCGTPLASGRVAQRMTVWCPNCQPEWRDSKSSASGSSALGPLSL